MTSWIILLMVIGIYVAFLYLSHKWMGENIDHDHWWDKQPPWLGWTIFAGWFPVLSIFLGFMRTFLLAKWLFGGEEYDRDFWDDIPDFSEIDE